MAWLLDLRSLVSILRWDLCASDSVVLHSGQRLAKPGLSGFNSNSSPQTVQVLMGNAISIP